MTPTQLDIVLNGAFIYRASDGKLFASFDYRLGKYGAELVRRSGPLSESDLSRSSTDVLADHNAALASEAAA